MLYLIVGGSGSGKSAYAENLAVTLYQKQGGDERRQRNGAVRSSQKGRLIYAATMHRNPEDPEIESRIRKHRGMRQGKGFITLEIETDLSSLVLSEGDVLILEDLINLMSNEWYGAGGCGRRGDLKERIVRPLLEAAKKAEIVVVGGDVMRGDTSLGAESESFVASFAALQNDLAKQAAQFTEVVYGIPMILKGAEVCF